VRNEPDSHADTCALGSNFVPLHYTGCVSNVLPSNSNTYAPECDVPIVTRVTAYTDQATGQVYILEKIKEGLWSGQQLTNSLINPNHLRYAGVTVQDPFHSTDPLAITQDDAVLHLQSQGTTIFFETSTPTPNRNSITHHASSSPLTPNGIHTPYSWSLCSLRRRKMYSAERSLDCHKYPRYIVSMRWRKT
jgi:hypothetical protein